MYSNSTRAPRFSLRTSHRRPMRLGTSHRDVPSAWAAPSKDRDLPSPPPTKKRR